MTGLSQVVNVCYHRVLLFTGEDDLQDVRLAVGNLARRWKDLGLSLGICLSDLDAINVPSRAPSECLREMLAIWLKQSYKVRTIHTCTLPSLLHQVHYSLSSKGSRLEPIYEEPLQLYVTRLITIHVQVLGFLS